MTHLGEETVEKRCQSSKFCRFFNGAFYLFLGSVIYHSSLSVSEGSALLNQQED